MAVRSTIGHSISNNNRVLVDSLSRVKRLRDLFMLKSWSAAAKTVARCEIGISPTNARE